MPGRDTDPDREPSLELPSFGLRRRRKRQPEPRPTDSGGDTEVLQPRPTDSRADTEVLDPRPTDSGGDTEVLAPRPTDSAAEAPRPARRRRERPTSGPRLGGLSAALLAGAVVGLLAVGLSFASLQACEAARGTSSCGGGPGFFLLLAVLVLLTYVGSWLLGTLGVEDAGSTSFLAVGLLAVVALLFLTEVLMSAWMVVVIPLVAAGTFALSHKVTTSVAEE